jgi:hypothetical protein
MNQDPENGTGQEDSPEQKPPKDGRLRPLQVISSVLAAGLGVQSSSARERDFRQGRAMTFIVAGILFTLLFIGTVVTVVKLVLGNAG